MSQSISKKVIVTLEGVTPETGCSVQVLKLLLISFPETRSQALHLGRKEGVKVNHLIFQARTSYLPSEIVWGQRLCYHIGRQKLFKSPPFSGLNIRQWCMIRRRPSMQSPTQPSTPLFQTTLQGALLSVNYVTKSR